jgi:hypothetical protein
MKKITTIAAFTIAATALTGCAAVEDGARAAVQVVTPWQDDLRDYLIAEWDADPSVAEGCFGLTVFGIDTPEQIGALAFAFDDGQLPAPNVTMADYAAEQGMSVPYDLPRDLSFREVAVEAGSVMLDYCGIDH